jgi:serine/threonine protein kinase
VCRDIKLENLFISSHGHLQLGDFGLAISVLEERAISPVGTLEYMAPEILRLPSTGAGRVVGAAAELVQHKHSRRMCRHTLGARGMW